MHKIIEENMNKIVSLCEQYHIKELYIFGSVLSENFKPASDIDLLVQFTQLDHETYFDNYMDLKEQLERLFKRPVDLVENQAIVNPVFRKKIDMEKHLLYERKSA